MLSYARCANNISHNISRKRLSNGGLPMMPTILPMSSCLRADTLDQSDHALCHNATEPQYAEANAMDTVHRAGPTHGKVAITHAVKYGLRHARGPTPVVQTVPVRTVLNRPNANLGTAEHGCAAADASTANDVITTTTPTRPVSTREKVPEEQRGNRHDSNIRGINSFLCAPDFALSLATLLSETDGAVRVAPDPHLSILWTAKAIAEIGVRTRAKARVSPRTKAANERAQLAKPLTVKKESRRANSIATANVLAGKHASIGMPMNAGTFLKKDIARMGTIAPTNM